MKIVHMVEAFGGGAFQSVCLLVNELAKIEDNEVTLFYATRAQTPANYKEMLDPRIRLVKSAHMQRELNFKKDWNALQEIQAYLREHNPDVVHLHCSKAGFLGRLAAYRNPDFSGKVFYSPRGFAFLDASSKKKALIYKWLEVLAGKLFPGTVVGCSKDEATLAQQTLGIRSVAQIDNAVALEPVINALPHRKMPMAAPYSNTKDCAVSTKPAHPLVIASTGRICEQKYPELFDEVAHIVHAQRPGQFRFVWMGKDKEFDFKHVDESYGWLPQQDMLDWMSAHADVYVQASRFEGMPIAVMQCQMIGICTVVSQVPGNTSVVVNEKTGLIAPLNASELANAIIRLEDEEFREKLAQAAKQYATEQFVPSRLISQYMALYQGRSKRLPC